MATSSGKMLNQMKKGISRVRSLSFPSPGKKKSTKDMQDPDALERALREREEEEARNGNFSDAEDDCDEDDIEDGDLSIDVSPPALLGAQVGGLVVVDNTKRRSVDSDEAVYEVKNMSDLHLDEEQLSKHASFSSDCSVEPLRRNSAGASKFSVLRRASPNVLAFVEELSKHYGQPRNTPSGKKKTPQKENERGRVVSEVVSSEESFRDFLQALQKVYAVKLKKELNVEQHKLCFGSIDQLFNFSQTFLAELKKAIGTNVPGDACIGQLYCKLSPFFKMYKAYSSTHCQIAEVVDELYKKRANFRKLCEECKNDPLCRGQTLQSILIMPIQRIPRHVLLIKELLKNTLEDHADRQDLERALHALGEIAQSMNQEIGDTENSIKILEIQQSMTPRPELFRTGRVFIRSGTLKKRGDHGGLQELVFFLFSDCLVYAKPLPLGIGGAKYQFRRMIQVARVHVLENRSKVTSEIEEEDEVDEVAEGPEEDGLLSPASAFDKERSGIFPCISSDDNVECTGVDHGDSFSSSSGGSAESPSLPAPSPMFPSISSRRSGKESVLSKREDLFPFEVHGTKTILLYATSESERQSWVSDLELNCDPNVETDLEIMERQREEERKKLIAEAEERVKDMRVSDPVRVYSATAWFRLNEGSTKQCFSESPEIQLKFLVSKTGSDLCVPGPVRPLSLLSLTLTVLSARDIVPEYFPVAAGKQFHGVYVVVTFGKTVHKTKIFTMQEEPTWMEEFRNLDFVAGFFSTIHIRVKQAMQPKPRNKDPCLALVDINMQDVLGFTGLEVSDPDHQTSDLFTGSKAIQRKISKLKQPKGLQVSSTPFLEGYKMNQIRPKTETLPLSCKPLPETPKSVESLPDLPPRTRLSIGSTTSTTSTQSTESRRSSLTHSLSKDQLLKLTNRPLPLPPQQLPASSHHTAAV